MTDDAVKLTPEDWAWVGPFPSEDAFTRALDAAISEAGCRRDDDEGELVSIPFVRVGAGWWANLPAPLARGPSAFFVELAIDPEDEWGPPLGYDVFAMSHRGGHAFRGEATRRVREPTHPDDGAFDGGVAEARLLSAGAPREEEERVEIGIVWGDVW